MLVRDEEDIIYESVPHLLSWIDHLYILDLGSIDSTWLILREFAKNDPRITLHSTKPTVYRDNLRCILFDEYRNRFSQGDWILKIDADEFYEITPPKFVKLHLQKGETSVYLAWFFFRITDREVDSYSRGEIDIQDDRSRPISERRRYYQIPDYGEPRMFRYRTSMQWPETVSFPFNAGYLARQRIPIRHYPHRDPAQMTKRYELRAAMMKLTNNKDIGSHWKHKDWMQDIVVVEEEGNASNRKASGLDLALGGAVGELFYLKSGDILPKIDYTNHLSPPHKRLLQRIIHLFLLPVLDHLRPKFSKKFEPERIPKEVTDQLRSAQ